MDGIMITKKCKKCGAEKDPASDYYANDNSCKECRRAMVKANREKNAEYYKLYERSRSQNPDRVAARKAYSMTPEGIKSASKSKVKWRARNAAKAVAHSAVNNAIRDGRLSKPHSCESCGKSGCRIEGHHEDYSRPLDVRWLCSECHRDLHAKCGNGISQ